MAYHGKGLIRYEGIGRCIYCGAVPSGIRLTDEHVFPFALTGQILVEQASCKACEKYINKNIENPVLTKSFGIVRAHVGTWTRNPKNRVTTFTCDVLDHRGKMVRATLPIDEFPDFAMPVANGTPGIFRGDLKAEAVTELKMIIKRLEKGGKYRQIDTVSFFLAGALERMLAKIAHSYAIGTRALDQSFEPLLPPLILGDYPYIWTLIGSDGSHGDFQVDNVTNDHFNKIKLGLKDHEGTEYLCAKIQLFAPLGMPIYEVVVGRRAKAAA